jgi:Cu/Ag efflux protein CusF
MRRLLGTLLMVVALPLAAQSMTEAEVRKVDKDAGKLTLKHGPIPNLEMPPMTMVFRVKEAGMLDAVKAGDKVSFQAEKVGGQYVVTKIEPAK